MTSSFIDEKKIRDEINFDQIDRNFKLNIIIFSMTNLSQICYTYFIFIINTTNFIETKSATNLLFLYSICERVKTEWFDFFVKQREFFMLIHTKFLKNENFTLQKIDTTFHFAINQFNKFWFIDQTNVSLRVCVRFCHEL